MNAHSGSARPDAGAWKDTLVFERRGGLAGFDERLAVEPDGRARLERGGQAPADFEVGAATRERLARLVPPVLPRLGADAPGGGVGADSMTYRLHSAAGELACAAEALPDDLRPLVETLEAVLATRV